MPSVHYSTGGYLSKNIMKVIETESDILHNIETFEDYLVGGNEDEKEKVVSLIKRGTCFIAYKINNETRFVPSRFVGYLNNNLRKHSKAYKDGRITNKAINPILNSQPLYNDKLEKQYRRYCESLGFNANEKGSFGVQRKFWDYFIDENLKHDINNREFMEGNLVERMHKQRERNPKVIGEAKELFINKYGKVFCEVCGFDFEKEYGEIGKNFIEGHHTIAVKDMKPNHKTVVEDIALLCSNCHSMIHSRKEMLSILELKEILRKNKSKK